MSADCERWEELSDCQAIGETLSHDAEEFLRDHARACGPCGRNAALFRELRISDQPESVPSEREIDDVLLGVANATRQQRHVHRRLAGGVAAALALAAGLALWITARDDAASGGAHSSLQAQSSGPVAISEREESANPLPPSGEAGCSEVVTGVLVCMAPGTTITSKDLASKHRVLGLAGGRVVVSLVPQPAGTSFSIATEQGRVTAVGTVFSVESSDDGVITARVVEGKVIVREKDTSTGRPLRAGESLRLGSLKPSTLTVEERERDLELLPPELRHPLREPAPAPSASAPAPNPEALLQRALALRARGQFRRAAEIYRQIHQASPGSAAGGTALMSLAELSLSSLNDPRAALTAFDAYLATGGALSQEAAFGRIRALRALGRTAEERSAIERFVALYPKVPQSRVLRERLNTLAK
ncbi:MAG: FecR domain-containing protein [Myxococcota bacterium]|nr:FecR domain-containing protein [Myxococcota bacterium]